MIRDRLWLCDLPGKKIHAYRPGQGILNSAQLSFQPRNVAILQSGKVVAVAKDKAAVLSPTGDLLQEPSHTLGWLKTACPAHGTDPVIFACDQEGETLYKLDGSQGGLEVVWAAATEKMPRAVLALPPPMDLVFVACKTGNIPASQEEPSFVQAFRCSDGTLMATIAVPFGARGLAYRRTDGTLWVSCFGRQTGDPETSGDGTTVAEIDVVTFQKQEHTCPAGPFGMTVDIMGRLWVVCAQARQLWSPHASGLDLPGGCLSIATHGNKRCFVTYKDEPKLTEIDTSDWLQAAIVGHHDLPAVFSTETLGDWSGAWHADWLNPTQDANGNGQTDQTELLSGLWPFPA